MTTIGAAWLRQKENSKDFYYSISMDKAILPFTFTEEKRLILKENKNKANNDKAPDFYLDIYIPNKEKPAPKETSTDEEEIFF